MRISGLLLLLFGLLAVGLYLPPPMDSRAQQPGTVSVRPRSTANQPGMPEVKATVDRNRVPLGDEVTFTLSPAHVLTDSRYKVTLFFGDGARQLMSQPRIVHPYAHAGTYTYSILVEPASQPKPTPTPPLAIPNVKFTAAPTSVEINQPVTFAAQLSHPYPNIRFRFVFADGSQTAWQSEANATHAYRSPGTYQAYVDLGVSAHGSIEQAGGSQRESIQVNEPPRPNVSVKLSASATSVEVAAPVTFTARVNPQQSNARYRFDFGDQTMPTGWQANSRVSHRYNSAGRFAARVEVRVANRLTGSQSASGNPVMIEVKNSATKPAVDLKVIPDSVPLGVPVFFRAIPSNANAQARYRFDFGDETSPSSWSPQSEQTHIYASAGTYPVFVEMSASSDEPIDAVAVSTRQRVRVTPIGGPDNTNGNANSNTPGNTNSNTTNSNANTNGNANTNLNGNANSSGNTNGNANANASPSALASASETPSPAPVSGTTEPNDWWKYVIIVAIILFVAYQAASYIFAPRPTFVPHLDPGKADAGAGMAIDLQMEVDPNISGGEFKLDTQGDSFIKSERTEQ